MTDVIERAVRAGMGVASGSVWLLKHQFPMMAVEKAIRAALAVAMPAADRDAVLHVRALEDALIWCSGSADFTEGGQAHAGWQKICAPLLADLIPNSPPAGSEETDAMTALYAREVAEHTAYMRECEAKRAIAVGMTCWSNGRNGRDEADHIAWAIKNAINSYRATTEPKHNAAPQAGHQPEETIPLPRQGTSACDYSSAAHQVESQAEVATQPPANPTPEGLDLSSIEKWLTWHEQRPCSDFNAKQGFKIARGLIARLRQDR